MFTLLDQTLRPADGERMGILLELLDEVTTRVPVWRMGCDISAEAAEMAYRAMSGNSAAFAPISQNNANLHTNYFHLCAII